MPAIDWTIGTVMSIKRDGDIAELDLVDRCLYDHDESEWPRIIARSQKIKRFIVTMQGGKVTHGCEDQRVIQGLEARVRKTPDILTAPSFTFKLANVGN